MHVWIKHINIVAMIEVVNSSTCYKERKRGFYASGVGGSSSDSDVCYEHTDCKWDLNEMGPSTAATVYWKCRRHWKSHS